eukprot:CCRYP_003714-RD/>CCRYP_003714-RD protein AED:0.34 eAED:0.34 QI:140/0.66/0.85/1/0.66/0.42/7/1908/789
MFATMDDSHSSRTSTEESSHASSRRSSSSRSINSSTSSRTSRTSASRSTSSRTSGSSRYSRSNPGQRPQQGKQQLSTIRSVSSAVSASSSSSSRAELSVPSSFGGRAAQRALVKRGEDSVTSQSEEGSETQLALRVEKETRPVMHLLRLLKEMEGQNGGGHPLLTVSAHTLGNLTGKSKNNAIASLINEFEKEVTTIERRITNPNMICDEASSQEDSNGTDSSNSQIQLQELPPDWIALEDPDITLRIVLQVTGETTWDRPVADSLGGSSQMDSENSFNTEYSEEERQQQQTNEKHPLPPDWVALEDPDSGDIYYANEVTGETTWDRPTISNNPLPRGSSLQRNKQQQPIQNTGENNNSSSNFSNDYQSNDDDDQDDDQESEDDGSEESAEDEISADESLPRDWIPLVDPDSGDVYFCNEVTGQVTWEKPQFDAEEKTNKRGGRRRSPQAREEEENDSSSQQLDSDEDGTEDDAEPASVEDDDLPDGWFSIVEPDSGDVYYSNEITGETTWDKPIRSQTDNIRSTSQRQSELQRDAIRDSPNSDRDDDGNNELVEDDLPPGWVASVDPATGDEYFYNEETGETTWDKPLSSHERTDEELEDSSTFSNSESTNGWFSVVDPQSGDVYYANEKTGETSWDKPQALLRLEKSPHKQDEKRLSTNGNTQDGNDGDDEDLPDGWFAVTDPQSGETYYANEETGATSWDRPTNAAAAAEEENSLASGWFAVVDPASGETYYANEQGDTSWDKPFSVKDLDRSATHEGNTHGMSRLSLSMHDNTVYEDDSVTSSQY